MAFPSAKVAITFHCPLHQRLYVKRGAAQLPTTTSFVLLSRFVLCYTECGIFCCIDAETSRTDKNGVLQAKTSSQDTNYRFGVLVLSPHAYDAHQLIHLKNKSVSTGFNCRPLRDASNQWHKTGGRTHERVPSPNNKPKTKAIPFTRQQIVRAAS